MAHSSDIRNRAAALRRHGKSIAEIASDLKIAVSTASVWCRGISVSKPGLARLADRKAQGSARGRGVVLDRRSAERKTEIFDANDEVGYVLQKNRQDNNYWRLTAALLYWCEGGKKGKSAMCFINSDPSLVKAFLMSLRKGFVLDETRFRALLHLHSYHDEKTQQRFWSNVTGIGQESFHRSFRKLNSGKRKRDNYPGCISIRYEDASLARKLRALYSSFAEQV